MKKPGDQSGEPTAERLGKLEVSVAHSACEWRQAKAALGREHGLGAGRTDQRLLAGPHRLLCSQWAAQKALAQRTGSQRVGPDVRAAADRLFAGPARLQNSLPSESAAAV
jgi:hypothetical protein